MRRCGTPRGGTKTLYGDERDEKSVDGRSGLAANLFGRRHGLEGARDDLCRTSPVGIVRGFRFEELGVSEDDAELIIEPVEQQTQRSTSRESSRNGC